jgi:hypothetical protein
MTLQAPIGTEVGTGDVVVFRVLEEKLQISKIWSEH